MNGEEYDEKVHRLTSEFVEDESFFWHKEGTNDYSNTHTDIVKIVDREGKEHEPVWGEESTQLFSGVITRTKDRRHYTRIAREACPVRVLFRRYYEYVSYDNWEHNSSWTSYWWVRYEA